MDRNFRGRDQACLGKYIFDLYRVIARHLGNVHYLHAVFSAPQFIYLSESGYNRSQTLGELTYDHSPDATWYVSLDKIPLDIQKIFRDGRQPRVVYGV